MTHWHIAAYSVYVTLFHLCDTFKQNKSHILPFVRTSSDVRMSIWFSSCDLFLLAAVTYVPFMESFHIWLLSSYHHPVQDNPSLPNPKIKVVHLYLRFSICDQVSPVCYNFFFPAWNLFIFGLCLLIIILLHSVQDAPTPAQPQGRFTYIFDSVVATKFLQSAVTSVSLHGIFSYLAHVFLSFCPTPALPQGQGYSLLWLIPLYQMSLTCFGCQRGHSCADRPHF